MKRRTISIFLAVTLLFSTLSQMVLKTNATEPQKGDGWGNWSDYVLEDTVVIYPVQGGNIYLGQDVYSGLEPEGESITEMCLLSADSTVTEVIIPSTVNGLTVSSLGEFAFSHCTQLTYVEVPATIKYVWGSCFYGCPNLNEISIPDSNTNAYTVDGVLYAKSFNEWTNTEIVSLELYPAGKKDEKFAIPHGVTSISHWAFGDATNLRSISIPDSIRDIQSGAFGDQHSNVNFTSIYYEGSEATWKEILIGNEYGYNTIAYTPIHFNRYESFVKSTENDSAVTDDEALKEKYGASFQEQFISCLGADIQPYPSGIYGIVSMVAVDLNNDNIDERIVLRVSQEDNNDEAQIIAEVYQCSNGYTVSASRSVYTISFCAAVNLYLFYSNVLGEYCIVVDSHASGSYTGVNSWSAEVFTITEDAIGSYAYWESVPFVGINADFEAELKAINAPYAKYCTEYENPDSELYCQPLCEIEHEVYGDAAFYMNRDHKLTIKSTSGIQANTEEDHSLVVFSDYTNLSVRKGSTITLSAGILADGGLADDVSGITFQIEDTSILSVSTTDIKDNCRYVKLNALIEGTTTVVFNDSNTGFTAMVPVTVHNNNYHSYTLNSVPTQNIEKYPTNFYNVNGLYIDSYKYTVNDDLSATVSFDVYNTNYSYGVVEIFDEKGNLEEAVLIDKMASSSTGIKESLVDNLGYLVRDIFQGDLLSYRQESGFSKMTPVSVKAPQNGYIKISTDPEDSSIVSMVNYADLLLSMLDLTGEITGFSEKSKDYASKLTAKIVNEKIFTELVSDGEKMTQTLWKNIGKEALITSEAMGNFVDTAIKNLKEFGLLDVVLSTASDCGWSVSEKVFTDLSGPFGAALKVMFTFGKAENIILQHHNVTHSTGFGSIYIQNQGGGLRSCQQIKVVGEDAFSSNTSLNVFSVTLDSVALDGIKAQSPEVYEAITNGITHTYNISLLQNGDEAQPSGEVTVYIPIPEEFQTLKDTGELTGRIYGKVKIYRVEEDSNLTEMDVKVEDECFVFTTDHFSLYTIVGYDAWKDATYTQDEHSTSPIMIIGIVAAIAAVAGILVVIRQKKKGQGNISPHVPLS